MTVCITLQVKAALGPGVKTSTMPQQIRQLTLQQQLMAQQRKLPAQKVTQLGQVMVCIFYKILNNGLVLIKSESQLEFSQFDLLIKFYIHPYAHGIFLKKLTQCASC